MRADAYAADALAFLPALRSIVATCVFSSRSISSRSAPIELVGDIEQMLGELVGRHIRQQRTAYAQVDVNSVLVGNQRIGRLLNPIMQEPVCAILRSIRPA